MSSTQAPSILRPHLLLAQYQSLGKCPRPSSLKEHFRPSPHHFPRPTFSQGRSSPKVISSPWLNLFAREPSYPQAHHFIGPTFCLAIIHLQRHCKRMKLWSLIITIPQEVRVKERGQCFSVKKKLQSLAWLIKTTQVIDKNSHKEPEKRVGFVV